MNAILLIALSLLQQPVRPAILSGQIVVDGGGALPTVPMRFAGPPGTFIVMPRGPQGNFTINLPEGDYELKFVSMQQAGSGPSALAPNYHVKSIVAGGTPVDVRAVKVRASNAPLTITLETKEYKVSGRVAGLEGLLRNTTSSLLLNPDRNSGLPSFSVNVSPDGTFAINKVPPGTYLPRVLPDAAGFFPDSIRVIDRDITGVELRLPTIVEVHGRVLLESGMSRPRLKLQMLQGTSRGPLGSISMEPGGAFQMRLPEGDYRISVTDLSAGYQLKAFSYGTTDVLSMPVLISGAALQNLVLTFGYAGNWYRVSGHVVGADIIADPIWRGVQLSGVVVGPLEAKPDANGNFVFPNVPPGSYTLRVNVPPHMAASAPVTILVNRDLDNLQLQVTPPQGR
jgi:hypothetical protein